MRHASVPMLVVLLGCAAFGCASPRAHALAEGSSGAATPASERGAELYGRYCTGCHATNVRADNGHGGAPALMHIQARVGMATMPAWVSEAITREDARQIVDYLDARRATRLAD